MIDDKTNEQGPASLDFILKESRDAHDQLLNDLQFLDARAGQQMQTGLVVIGAVVAVSGTALVKSFNAIGLILLLVDVVVLAVCVVATAAARYRGEFYSGRIFPDILQTQVDEEPTKIKTELLDTIASSYYYNYEGFIQKGKRVSYIGNVQVAAMIVLIVIFIAEAALSL
jgi:hypothetical protein